MRVSPKARHSDVCASSSSYLGAGRCFKTESSRPACTPEQDSPCPEKESVQRSVPLCYDLNGVSPTQIHAEAQLPRVTVFR